MIQKKIQAAAPMKLATPDARSPTLLLNAIDLPHRSAGRPRRDFAFFE
jgi:hypothetical protein